MTDLSRCHVMPFGTRMINGGGRVCFRLWAPGAKQVELNLQGSLFESSLPMESEADGWFSITTAFAAAGSHYQYCIDGKHWVPDPASRYQAYDVNGPSVVIDPKAWQWKDQDWKGLPWERLVFYQVHVGTFSAEGTFAGLKKRLDYLVDLGITAIQLMPIADFPGRYNWGYDGVLPFAPDSTYGTPDELKDLIATAHTKGLMVFNDVVYNHFGPEGNYLALYAPAFFTRCYHTPWGDAIDFDPAHNNWVRQFFIHNALYWLEEYHFDGLRLDAVHAIFDESSPDFLQELAKTVRQGPGRDRQIYLVLENDNNASHYLRHKHSAPQCYFDAQWNDDLHHALHVLLTKETSGYYQDYAYQALQHLGRCLTQGFAFQGESSVYRGGKSRGEYSADLPLTAFIAFLQNHDQIGNRAMGERVSCLCSSEALRAVTTLLLLIPSPPLLFMGQEWACDQPFNYFVDFSAELGEQVKQGRLEEFCKFSAFADAAMQQEIPPPNASSTFEAAKLAWGELNQTLHQEWLKFHRELLQLRQRCICNRLNGMETGQAQYRVWDERAISVKWRLGDGSTLILAANLSHDRVNIETIEHDELLFASDARAPMDLKQGHLRPWSVIFMLQHRHD